MTLLDVSRHFFPTLFTISTPTTTFLSPYPTSSSTPRPLYTRIQRITLFTAAFSFKVEENGHVPAYVLVGRVGGAGGAGVERFSFVVPVKEVKVTHLPPSRAHSRSHASTHLALPLPS